MAPVTPKLRCAPVLPPFRVVLLEPEIPPNTGSVARSCAATGSPLHLIEPLGFRIDDRSLKRAGIDYWHLVDVNVHPSFAAFQAHYPETRLHFFSSEAERSYHTADIQPGDALVFGKESVGLPRELLRAHPDRVWGIPTSGRIRSLNLSNAVSIVLFEVLRRAGGFDQLFVESPDP
ncbi:MAG TPA: tRNA (cytidine(34)-2'-O)-methyltransferase [Polyangiales bacterium]|nr:tRNA (cytidine(34)-2'-O)-methyltransferase [Polyangiales bacterium]